MADLWIKPSDTILATLEEQVTVGISLPVLSRSKVSLISGKLPPGLRLEGNAIVGTPYEVPRTTEYRFVLRATLDQTVRDRTYKLIVEGADEPVWVTPEGSLAVGNNDAFYILDNSPIEFQLEAYDPDLAAGQTLNFYMNDGDGQLPPGTQLTPDGRIVGIVDPLLAIEKGLLYSEGTYDTSPYDLGNAGYDFGIRSSNGYDSFYYDTTVWDFSYLQRPPKKLNRYYQFKVNVTDGDLVVTRTFKIFVVGDDFFRADNTILQVGTGTFTADNTNLRTPIWLTPSDLGIRRANNYITVFLDVIDTNSQVGFVSYSLEDYNDDGSPSILPPGMKIDLSNGEIAGRVPYQSEVTKTYKFTVTATRYTPDQIDENVSTSKTFTIKLLGEVNSKITWLTESELGTLNSNIISVLRVEAETNITNSRVLYSLASGRLPPGLQLSFDGEIVGKVNAFGQNTYRSIWQGGRNYKTGDVVKYDGKYYQTLSDHLSTSSNEFENDLILWAEFNYTRSGLTVFDNDKFQLDGATTTVDREYRFVVNAQDQFNYSMEQKEFVIKVNDPEVVRYTNLSLKPFLKEGIKQDFRNFISDPEIFIPEYIYRPSDPNFGIQRNIKVLIFPGIETKSLPEFVAATAKNHKRKKYRIGELKTAIATTPGTNDVVYEVVYLEVIDPADPLPLRTRKKFKSRAKDKISVNQIGPTPENQFYEFSEKPSFVVQTRTKTISIVLGEDFEVETRDDGTKDIIWTSGLEIDTRTEKALLSILTGLGPTMTFRPSNSNVLKADTTAIDVSQRDNNVKYISNITNMRDNIREIGAVNREFVPLWMRSPQTGSVNELGFTPAIVLCYTKPGTSEIIKAAIKAANFDFSRFDLDMDRYIMDSIDSESSSRYLVFHNYSFNV